MTSIRPYQLFSVATNNIVEAFSLKMPGRYDPLLIETMLLVGAARIVNAKNLFEFGTFQGTTTLNLALNFPRVWTLDTDRAVDCPQKLDADWMQVRLGAKPYCASRANVTQLLGDSRTIDLHDLYDSMDFIFIDGAHDLDAVAMDTRNAFQMLRSGGCIAWHDYRSGSGPDVTAMLDERARGSNRYVWVEDTYICLYFDSLAIVEKLVQAKTETRLPSHLDVDRYGPPV